MIIHLIFKLSLLPYNIDGRNEVIINTDLMTSVAFTSDAFIVSNQYPAVVTVATVQTPLVTTAQVQIVDSSEGQPRSYDAYIPPKPQMSVTCPTGAQPGAELIVEAPNGSQVTCIVPIGVTEGQKFFVDY